MLECRPTDRASELENESKTRVRKKNNITDLKLAILLLEYTGLKSLSLDSVVFLSMDGWIYIALRPPLLPLFLVHLKCKMSIWDSY